MSEMKVSYLGVARRHGKSKDTGNPYDICELFHAWPLTPKRTKNYDFETHGHEQRIIKLDPQCLNDFAAVKLGSEIMLELAADPENPMRNLVVGIAEK